MLCIAKERKNYKYFRHIIYVAVTYYRQKTSGAEGERLKEAASINRSLSVLGYFS